MRRWLGLLFIAGLIVFVAGTLTASTLEERDSFCTSCHLAPEVTYHDRSLAAQAAEDPFLVTDLASFHYWDDASFKCVDCHRGDNGIVHRANVLALAAGDTLIYLFGAPDEAVSKGTVPNVDPNNAEWQGPERFNRRPDILNAGCLRCHQDALTLVGFDNHFHNRLPAAQEAYAQTGGLNYPPDWSANVGTEDLLQADDTVLTCLDCHRSHVEGFESEYYLDTGLIVFPACVQCHKETGRGPLDLNR